jgi:metal-dependent amidase/aminoacylase/carboxypeptidase family protein
MARATDGLLVTVGALQVRPGVVNAVPGEVAMTLEIRAPGDAMREEAGAALTKAARDIARRRGLGQDIARSYGLEFLPLIEEHFALLVDRRAWFEAPMQKLMAFCATETFANRATTSGGYDMADLGKVIWNA